VCDSLETLSGDIDGLKNVDLKADGAAASVQESLDSIRSDVEAVKSDAASELSEPLAGLETSLDSLSKNIDAVKTAGTVSAESAQAIGDSVAAVSASWEALKTAAPDCNL
jgi:septal ring factor EnvC (AmiA/AmiB activator)